MTDAVPTITYTTGLRQSQIYSNRSCIYEKKFLENNWKFATWTSASELLMYIGASNDKWSVLAWFFLSAVLPPPPPPRQDPPPRKNGEIGELVKNVMKYLGKKENFEFFGWNYDANTAHFSGSLLVWEYQFLNK